MLIFSLIFKLPKCTPVFLGLSLSPVPHTAGLWDKNFFRDDGLDLLDCMDFACNELEFFAPQLLSHFSISLPCALPLPEVWFLTSLHSAPQLCALCPAAPQILPLTCSHPRRESLFFSSTSLSRGPLPPPVFCSSSPFLTLNSFFYVLSLTLFVFSYSVHNLVSAVKALYSYSLSRHGNLQSCINT